MASPQDQNSQSSGQARPQRVLACLQCQQRKVKCDRKFPCANCVRTLVQCLPASKSPRQRRRRFPERDLLDRLHRYEGLLRQHNIEFEPLHPADKTSPSEDGRSYETESLDAKATGNSETTYEAKKIWKLLKAGSRNSDDDYATDESASELREGVVRKAWDQFSESSNLLLFGSRQSEINLSTLHPDQVNIFRLWQIYLNNLDPLLKVTHTPTLQTLLIDAASDVTKLSPALQALMFSIYCVSILSLGDDECQSMFGSPKADLLRNYQFGCQQALLECGFLRSSDRDCLTALYFYLISIRPEIDPRSLSSMLAIALRVAQRMGIHNESTLAECTALEAELRRRLWWALIIFDNRISEMSDHRTTMLNPTWDCKVPLNLNDFEMRPEMKTLPAAVSQPTEAIFIVVRSELGDFLRHSDFHLDFTNPSLKSIATNTNKVTYDGVSTFAKAIEDKFLHFCNPENPLQFLTLWMTRGYLAKYCLLEHYSKSLDSSVSQTDMQRDTAVSFSLRVLECDTMLMTSPLTKGFLWLVQFNFPFPPFVHLLLDLRKRPLAPHAGRIWETMGENYHTRFTQIGQVNPLFKVFSNLVLQAWKARVAANTYSVVPLELPRIVTDIQAVMIHMTSNAEVGINDNAMSMNSIASAMPKADGSRGPPYGAGWQFSTDSGVSGFPNMFEQEPVDFGVGQLDWSMVDWNSMYT